ncbi:MAG: LamB/YcsF family protein [Gemmataceae bacterium]|nr:LamB/YcsF family protein [Gemmataceae bacterium]
MEIDLSCDMAEGGADDLEILQFISTANVACCRHAGDPGMALHVLRGSIMAKVVVGAHPGHNDPFDFGRKELPLSPNEIMAECMFQVGGMAALAQVAGVPLKILKPHGGLYHQAGKNPPIARMLVGVATRFNLALVGLPGSALESACVGNVPYIPEGFADRKYTPAGQLIPRDQPNAFIEDPKEGARQALDLIRQGKVKTICFHGEQPRALAFARGLREELNRHGVKVRAAVP